MKAKLWLVGLVVAAFFAIPASAWAGSISGTVTTEPGAPAEEVFTVCAFGPSNTCVGVGAGNEYTLAGLAGGEYRVWFHSNSDPDFVSEYWQNVPSYDEARVLDLGAEDELTGIDAELGLGGEVHGTVTATGGAPLEGATACVKRVGASGPEFCRLTDENGAYAIAGIPPGSYKLLFEGPMGGVGYSPSWYNGKPTAAEADVLNLVAGGSVTADTALAPAGAIAGILTGEGEPLFFGEICVYELDETSLGCTFADEAGKYSFSPLRPGSYVVSFAYGRFQKEYSGGAENFAGATPVQVEPGATATLDADLSLPSGIRGTVIDAETGAPLESGYACAYSNGTPTFCYGLREGRYELEHLPPGTYQVYFEAPGYATQYYHGVVTESEATLVTVGTKMVSGVDAELSPAGAIEGKVTIAPGEPSCRVSRSAP